MSLEERIAKFPPMDRCFSGTVEPNPLTFDWPLEFDFGTSITFRDGARTFWHTHEGVQVLIGTSGRGWLKYRDSEEHEILPGVVVLARAGEEHWHGAAAGEDFTHVAFTNGDSEWLEQVTDPT